MENDCLASAINALDPNNYIEYSSITLVDPTRSIEDLVIKKDLYEKLSPEAKEVVEVIVNRPISFIVFVRNNSKAYFKYRNYNHRLKQVYDRTSAKKKYTPLVEKRSSDPNIIRNFFGFSNYKWSKVKNEIKNFCI